MRHTIKVNIPLNFSAQGKSAAQILKVLMSPFARQKINRAMALKFLEIARRNIGPSGPHRPIPWKGLSESYKKRIKYYGPPMLRKDGYLLSSIRMDSNHPSHATVFSSLDRATFHQAGVPGNNLPARPFFPYYP